MFNWREKWQQVHVPHFTSKAIFSLCNVKNLDIVATVMTILDINIITTIFGLGKGISACAYNIGDRLVGSLSAEH